MWNKKENTYDSTDVNYKGGIQYGADIHRVAVRTNQIVWDMMKVLDKKGLYGFHFSAQLGTKKTIIYMTHDDEEMLNRAKRELREFHYMENILLLGRVKIQPKRNTVKIVIIALSLLGVMSLIGGGVGYYLYTQTNLLNLDDTQEKDDLLLAYEPQKIEVDIDTLMALKESLEQHQKSETEQATIKAMVIATDVISDMVPDSLKEQYSSEAVVNKFKGKGGIELVLKDSNRSDADFNHSIAELNAYASEYVKNNNYDAAMKLYKNALDGNESDLKSTMETHADMGKVYEKSGNVEKAKVSYEEAVTRSHSLAQKDAPQFANTEAWNRVHFAKINQELNQTKEAESELQHAEAIYLKTVDLFASLAKSNPKEHEQNLAWAYNMVANFYYNDKKAFEASIEARKKAVVIYERLATKNPERFYERLFKTYNALAASYLVLDRFTLAQTSYQKAFDLTQTMRTAHPEEYRDFLAHSLDLLGVLYTKMEQFENAYKHLNQSKELYKKLVFENATLYQMYLLGVEQDMAAYYTQKREYAQAWQLYQETVTAYQKLSNQKERHYGAALAKALNNMAWIALIEPQTYGTQQAKKLLRDAIATAQTLEKIDHTTYRSLTATSYLYWGYLALQEGKIAEAFDYYDKSLALDRNYPTDKSYLLLLITKNSYIKANTLFKSMITFYTAKEQQAEIWMLYGKFYLEIDHDQGKKRLQKSLKLYRELNDTLKIEALKLLLDTNATEEQNS